MLPLFVAMLALFDKLGHALNGENILFQITIFFSAMLPLFVAMLPLFVVFVNSKIGPTSLVNLEFLTVFTCPNGEHTLF